MAVSYLFYFTICKRNLFHTTFANFKIGKLMVISFEENLTFTYLFMNVTI